jgi:hypothetical protein
MNGLVTVHGTLGKPRQTQRKRNNCRGQNEYSE